MDLWQSHIWSRGLAHVAPSTASYSTSMGRSVRSRLSKQHEHRWPTRFPSQAGGTLPASLTATIWSRRLSSHLCVSSDDFLEEGQGLQGWDGDVICGQAVAHCVGAEAGTVKDIGDFVFRPWLRFEIKKRPTCVLLSDGLCPTDFSDHPRNTPM